MNIINNSNNECIAQWPTSPWEIRYGDRIRVNNSTWLIVGGTSTVIMVQLLE